MRRLIDLSVLALTGFVGPPALVQSAPAQSQQAPAPRPSAPICRAELEGQVACQANRVCECTYRQAVPARGLPDRWAWDCGIKRPHCEPAPTRLEDYRGDLPPGAASAWSGTNLPPNVFVTLDERGRRQLVVNGQRYPWPQAGDRPD